MIRTNPVFWKPNPYISYMMSIGYLSPITGEIVIYCNETFGKENWDRYLGTLYFKYEKDAILFRLKYK